MLIVYRYFGPQLGNYYSFSKGTYFDCRYNYRSEHEIPVVEYLIEHVKRKQNGHTKRG